MRDRLLAAGESEQGACFGRGRVGSAGIPARKANGCTRFFCAFWLSEPEHKTF